MSYKCINLVFTIKKLCKSLKGLKYYLNFFALYVKYKAQSIMYIICKKNYTVNIHYLYKK